MRSFRDVFGQKGLALDKLTGRAPVEQGPAEDMVILVYRRAVTRYHRRTVPTGKREKSSRSMNLRASIGVARGIELAMSRSYGG